MSRFWSTIVNRLSPYTPGEQPQAQGEYGLVKLNTNENPYPPSPRVIQTIQQTAQRGLQKYPDPNGIELKKSLADYYSLSTEQIFVGNSSDEVLAHIFQGFFTGRVGFDDKPLLFPDITYGFYPVYAKLFNIPYELVALDLDFSLSIDSFETDNRGIIFANPNAPTGLTLGLQDIVSLLQKHQNSVIVVDEAYVDFGAKTAVSLIDKFDNLLVTQTFSKSRSLAGLRVGFACGNPDLIEALERVKNSFNAYPLDKLALAGACASLEDESYFQQQRTAVMQTRDRTTATLRSLGFEVLNSSANFVFAKPPSEISAQVMFQSLREHDIIVRYFDKPRINEFLRITIGTDEQMKRMFDVIKILLSEL